MNDIIEGFVVGGSTAITITNVGHAIGLTMDNRLTGRVEAIMSAGHSRRLRKLLAAAEKRSRLPEPPKDDEI